MSAASDYFNKKYKIKPTEKEEESAADSYFKEKYKKHIEEQERASSPSSYKPLSLTEFSDRIGLQQPKKPTPYEVTQSNKKSLKPNVKPKAYSNPIQESGAAFKSAALDSATLGLEGLIKKGIAKATGTEKDLKAQNENERIAREKNPIQSMAGTAAGYVTPGMGAAKVSGIALKGATKAAGKSLIKRAGVKAAKGAIEGGGMELVHGLAKGESPKQVAKRVGTGIAFGVAGEGIGAVGGKILKAIPKKAPTKTLPQIKYKPTTGTYKLPSKIETVPVENTVNKVTTFRDKSAKPLSMNERTLTEVGNRKINAYQFDHPEVKDHIQTQANYILDHEFASAKNGIEPTTQVMRDLKSSTNASYDDIRKGLEAIIKDHGAENTAVAKRVEMVIDEHLSKGFDSIYGDTFPADVDYIAKKQNIEGRSFTQSTIIQKGTEQQRIPSKFPQKQGQSISSLPSEPTKMQGNMNLPEINKVPKIEPQNVTKPNRLNNDVTLPKRQKERGFSHNVRTDANMNDELRDSFTQKPLGYDELKNKSTLERAQARFDRGYENAVNDWRNSINTFSPDDIPLSRLLANEAMKRGDKATARSIIADAAEKLTQAGQFSQAARILRQADDPGAFLGSLQRDINKLNRDGAKQYGKKWEDIFITDDELDVISGWDKADEAARDGMMEQIFDRISKKVPVSNMEKFDAWRRMAMLLNPKTHVRNVGGNVIMMGLRKAADTVGAGLEKIARVPVGQRTKSVGWSKDTKIKSIVDADWDANKTDLLKNGRYEIDSLNLLNREKPIFKNKKLEAVNEFSKWALNAGDAPFMQRAYKDALGQFVKANKLNAVTDAARAYATRRAEEATFKQANLLSNFISKAKRTKGVGKLVEAAVPFSKTPTNIVARSIEYSPVGLVKALYSVKTGKSAANVIEDLSKGLTGSAIAGLGFFLAYQGWARSERSTSKNAEALMNTAGQQPYSFNTPLGSYTFDWAQPFAVPLAMGMTVFEQLNKKDDVDIETVADSVASGSDTIFNMSMLQNIKSLLGGGFGSVSEQIAGLPVSYVEQALPTVAGQIARTIDPVKRNTYDPNPIKQFGNEIAAKTPGLSKTLQPNLDIFGKEQSQGNFIQQFLSPGYAKGKTDDPVTIELNRIYKSTKESDMLPKISPRKFTDKGKEVELSPEQVTKFQKEMGERNYSSIKAFLEDKNNKDLSDDEKRKRIANIVTNNYNLVKRQFIPK